MKKFFSIYILIITIATGVINTSCEDRDDIVDSLKFDRLFAPVGMKATVFKVTELNLEWTPVKGANKYVVEIYNDSLVFERSNLVYSQEVTTNKYVRLLEADSRLTARVKAIGENIEESKWNWVFFKTGVPDVFAKVQIGDIGADYITMRWTAATVATELRLTPKSGGTAINHTLSQAELAAGIATVNGLQSETVYTVALYNDTQRKSLRENVTTFKKGTVIIDTTSDLLFLVNNAEDGASFLLKPGDYLSEGIIIPISKSISISGFGENIKPTIHAQLQIGEVANLNLTNLIIDGTKFDGSLLDHALQLNSSGNCGAINVEGCDIMNYQKSLLAGSSSIAVKVGTILFNKCIVSNVKTSGADFIDIRAGVVNNLNLTNSTFYNCAPSRDFIRLDDASSKFPGETSNVLIDKCTLYKVSTGAKRILYVRYAANTLKVTNTIIAETDAYYTNQAKSAQPECSKNNYSNAGGFIPGGTSVDGAKYDESGSQTVLDPGFVNSEKGDFSVSNTTVKGNGTGDPRWIK